MFNATVEVDYPFSKYIVKQPDLNAEQEQLIMSFASMVGRKTALEAFLQQYRAESEESFFREFLATIDETKIGKPLEVEERRHVLESLELLVSKLVSDPLQQKVLAYQIMDRLFGFLVVQPLFEDGDLEEIMINNAIEIYVFHRTLGICKTNLEFSSERQFEFFLQQMTSQGGRVYEDLRLPDGSRANILHPPATKHVSVTIRKFRVQPFSIVDLIKNHTFSVDLASFLWVCIDGLRLHPLNIMIVGATASGKTTTLNALSSFIPPSERIVSMEDTRELNLYGMQNWIPTRTTEEMDLESLVRNSLRMRPDRIIVGEVRGKEALPLFTAMNVGHRGMLTTLHAEDAKDSVKRLKGYPMEVSPDLIPLVDIVVVQHRINSKKEGLIRRITQVAELSRLEGNVTVNEIFDFNLDTFRVQETSLPSQAKEKLSKMVGLSIPEINNEMKQRSQLLGYLVEKNIHRIEDVNLFMQKFYSEILMPKLIQKATDAHPAKKPPSSAPKTMGPSEPTDSSDRPFRPSQFRGTP
ncbi:Flp pilus assembly complex ATPase component TadA [Candidatus Micrarchaeota archaeon]|nr:Flp pilus assembly complex ATPase component TadA [Candidatus Micrarchaeota archaeon]